MSLKDLTIECEIRRIFGEFWGRKAEIIFFKSILYYKQFLKNKMFYTKINWWNRAKGNFTDGKMGIKYPANFKRHDE
jgi:hypothetical protein